MNGMASSHTTSLSIRSLSSSSLGEGSNLMYKATFTNVQTLCCGKLGMERERLRLTALVVCGIRVISSSIHYIHLSQICHAMISLGQLLCWRPLRTVNHGIAPFHRLP
jgi:hypothetical protein